MPQQQHRVLKFVAAGRMGLIGYLSSSSIGPSRPGRLCRSQTMRL